MLKSAFLFCVTTLTALVLTWFYAGRWHASLACHLAEVSGQRPYTAALGNTPYPGRRVVATGYHEIAMNREAADTGLMPDKDIATRSCS